MNRGARRRAVRDLLKKVDGRDLMMEAAVGALAEKGDLADRAKLLALRERLGDKEWEKLMTETMDRMAAEGLLIKVEHLGKEPIYLHPRHVPRWRPQPVNTKVEAKKKEVEEK